MSRRKEERKKTPKKQTSKKLSDIGVLLYKKILVMKMPYSYLFSNIPKALNFFLKILVNSEIRILTRRVKLKRSITFQ